MNLLTQSLTFTAVNTFVVFCLYLYVFFSDRQDYLKFWVISWFLYLVHIIFAALNLWGFGLSIFGSLESVFLILSAYFLAEGVLSFLKCSLPRAARLMVFIIILWMIVSTFLFANHSSSIPSPGFIFLSAVYAGIGIMYISYMDVSSPARYMVGVSFLVLALIKSDFMLFGDSINRLSVKYAITGLLNLFIALGMMLIYFQKIRAKVEKSEDKYRKIFESGNAVKFLLDCESGEIIENNKSAMEFYGSLLFRKDSRYISDIESDDLEVIAKRLRSIIKGECSYYTARHRKYDGSLCAVEIYPIPFDNEGKTQIYFIVHDASISEKSERLLRLNEDRLNSLYNLSMKHFNGYDEIISASMNEILTLTGSEIGMIFFDEKEFEGHDKICTRNGVCFQLDAAQFNNLRLSTEKIFGDPTFGISINNRAKTEIEIPDRKIKIDRAMTVSLISGDQIFGKAIVCNKKHEYDSTDSRQFHLFISGMLDIIVKKRMEENIRQTLNEKETYLKEIHHRVKNNFQIIISLLNHKMRLCPDEFTKEVLSSSINRIFTMALVHEKLYREDSLAEIKYDEYIKSLVYEISRSGVADSSMIEFSVDADPIVASIDKAVPLSLLINEILQNSVKHAFEPDSKGKIDISMKRNGKEITVMIRDNGKGIPGDVVFDSTSTLGMKLIKSLTEQIRGRLEVVRDNGFGYIIRFEL
ncbi:MAG TPA: histidine kinase dimerization/phosphoacceptor domain -containing protein [Spirochaetota bacterium]|nr:histidine kinase dimerization/phosphoacceptor domain -containing protein [Spirochaetota bacterium]